MAERHRLYADHLLALQLQAEAEVRRRVPVKRRLLLEVLAAACLLAIVALVARRAS